MTALIATKATPGIWLDSNTVLTAGVCAELVQAGHPGVMRYVSFAGLPRAGCISSLEAAVIANAGLQLLLVMHVRGTRANNFHWHPSACSGTDDGNEAAACAKAAGYPLGSHIFVDIEGVSDTQEQTVAYTADCQRAILGNGYLTGLYDGFDAQLDAAAKWSLPGNSYWAAPGQREVERRGYAIRQGPEVTIAGVAFDRDVLAPDLLGDVPMVASAAMPDVA
jgi:hypothetical protein